MKNVMSRGVFAVASWLVAGYVVYRAGSGARGQVEGLAAGEVLLP